MAFAFEISEHAPQWHTLSNQATAPNPSQTILPTEDQSFKYMNESMGGAILIQPIKTNFITLNINLLIFQKDNNSNILTLLNQAYVGSE